MNEQCQEQRESLREALTKECSREKAEAEFILIDEHDIKCDQEKLEMVTEQKTKCQKDQQRVLMQLDEELITERKAWAQLDQVSQKYNYTKGESRFDSILQIAEMEA